jgi:hypothetical protein
MQKVRVEISTVEAQSAPVKYERKSAGSLSNLSGETRATDFPSPASRSDHSPSRVVSPNPAGAETRARGVPLTGGQGLTQARACEDQLRARLRGPQLGCGERLERDDCSESGISSRSLLRRKAGTKTHCHAAEFRTRGSPPHVPPFGRCACAEQMTTVLPIHRIEERSKRFRHWVSWPPPYTQTRHVRGSRERS